MKKLFFITASILLSLTSLNAQSLTGREIMKMAEDAQETDSSATDMNMILINAEGDTSVRRLQTLIIKKEGLSKSLTVFKSPAAVENTRFLTVENKGRSDDQWIYLPALRKMRRIASGEKSGSFMGSDFSYSDMESRDIDDFTQNLLREESRDGTRCWVVESIPLPDTDFGDYSRMLSWIDQQTHIPVRLEYYSSGSDSPVKIMESSDIKQNDGIWTPMKLTMTTVRSGHRTVMEINQIKYNISINPGYFTTNFLQTGRLK